ncbi:helix-turn-helix domain-containing protein [Ruegeria atlantica]|uniref:Virulence-regulating protein VirS n=1 Tax=Ruegeria atlantica TaxID=81569 RepID=A0A0P1EWH6_9RHOB|nr:helix-turn-helix transcriptional regulator [Ruegeria atlantica]CUH46479.1 Virulence-regulating protein VirS [Ruegeria atlantica]
MDKISTCRAAYLIPFIDVLRDIGASVERELARAKLPTMVEETPEELVSNILSMDFLTRSARLEGVDDLGWLWVQKFSSSSFSAELLTALRSFPTVKARLDCLSNLIALEDSDTRVGLIGFNGSAEVYCDSKSSEIPSDPISEWTQVTVLIEAVRSITGENWSPDEIRFKSDFSVCDAARAANPNTRFLTQSAHTSIILPSSVLAASKLTCAAAQVPEPNTPNKLDGTENLKRLIRPYLLQVAPKIEVLADVMGVSPRSLQRKLKQSGSSYSELIETTRFEMAAEMLRDSDMPLIDIAMMFGYENQSNFGRSFRRVAGISPGKYRREMFGRQRVA